MIGDVQRSGGGYARASRAEQAANLITDLGWPLGTPPSSGPGAYPIPLVDTFWGARHHAGLDIDTRRGTPIRATTDGEVIRNRRGTDEGNYIAIEDARGRRHYYLHMLEPASPELRPRTSSAPGARVRKGQVIGYVGSTGRSDGMHLHYAIVLPNGHVVNPYPSLLLARQREQPQGVAGMLDSCVRKKRPAWIGQTDTDWRTLEIQVARIEQRARGWQWPAAALERVADPSAARTRMRELREGHQALVVDGARTFRLYRQRNNYGAARDTVIRMVDRWNGFENFAHQFAADQSATLTENLARGTSEAVDRATAAAGSALSSVGMGLFVIGLVGAGIYAAISASAHGARA